MFSIVTVVLDEYEELSKTFNSIINQSYNNIEWVVIHGGKNKSIIQFVLKQKDCIEIKYISEQDEGIYDAMNKGVSLSSGDFILFLNAGDILHDESVILNVFNSITKNDSYPDVVFGAAELLFSNGMRIVRKPKDIYSYIWHGLPANHQATYYRNTSIKRMPYDLKYKVCGDYYIIARLFIEKIDVLMIQNVLADFKIGGSSYQNPRLLIKDSYEIQKKILRIPIILRILSAVKRVVVIVSIFIIENSEKLSLKKTNENIR